MTWNRTVAITSLALLALTASIVAAAPLAEQRRDITRVSTLLKTAERFASKDRSEEAIAAFAKAQENLARHAGDLDSRLQRSFDRAVGQVERARAKLAGAGLELPPLANMKGGSPEPGETGEVSFVREIAPLIVAKCGRCHVQGTKGGLSMASYSALMRGSKSGTIVRKGVGKESMLAEVIVDGVMPPNGDPVSPELAQRLIQWMDEGAKFDGEGSADTPLAQLASANGAPKPKAKPLPKIPMAAGDETISFARDIAPILVESCIGCHGAGRQRAAISFANFEQLWKGGDSGPVLAPGNPDRSLIVQKLRGTAAEGDRMPQGQPALPDEKIAMVVKWIAEGARFDGVGVKEATARVAAIARAEQATSEELSAERSESAMQTWRLAIPDEPANQATSQRFLVVGNLPRAQLEQLAEQAETEATRVLQFYRQADKPLNKARITLFAFSKRIDYAEFGTMVERRQLPSGLRGHSRYDIITPYTALAYRSDDTDVTSRILVTEIAALWVADQSKGRLPRWFVRGTGMAAAAKLWAKDKEVRRWQDNVPSAVSRLPAANAFMTGKMPPASSDLVAFGFVDAMLRKPGKFDQLIEQVAKGKDFDEAMMAVFGRSPKELAEAWVASMRRR